MEEGDGGTLLTSWTNSLNTFSVVLCVADFRRSHHVSTLECHPVVLVWTNYRSTHPKD
jgi:hypothetical protein